jgi:uncharacterized protein YndB with AHSA1/START domain
MTKRSIVHGSFTIERSYAAPPARAFAAWADPKLKAKWFGGGEADFAKPDHVFDFKVGGREYSKGEGGPGQVYVFDVRYYDIVANERIVYAYEMLLNDARMSVSVATIEFKLEGKGTKMVMIEHGAYFDGLDTSAQRESGTTFMMDQLGTFLEGKK